MYPLYRLKDLVFVVHSWFTRGDPLRQTNLSSTLASPIDSPAYTLWPRAIRTRFVLYSWSFRHKNLRFCIPSWHITYYYACLYPLSILRDTLMLTVLFRLIHQRIPRRILRLGQGKPLSSSSSDIQSSRTLNPWTGAKTHSIQRNTSGTRLHWTARWGLSGISLYLC